ncbi:MAG: hypothetical protein HOV80_38530 [Polyangiaceae bacterium]|nr:hypothetical protein [Polyangiaceae bacterium]
MKAQLWLAALAVAAVVSCMSEPSVIQCEGVEPRADGLYECNEVLVRKAAQSCPAPTGNPGYSPPCSSDADCAAGSLCYCGDLMVEAERDASQGLCVPATCRTDADCGGEHCIHVDINEMQYEAEFYGEFRCTSAEDECRKGDDCVGAHDVCIFDASQGHLICEEAVRDG